MPDNLETRPLVPIIDDSHLLLHALGYTSIRPSTESLPFAFSHLNSLFEPVAAEANIAATNLSVSEAAAADAVASPAAGVRSDSALPV